MWVQMDSKSLDSCFLVLIKLIKDMTIRNVEGKQ
jgi:hypothetical protein